MAGKEYQDCTDSPAQKFSGNQPTETSYIFESERERSATRGQSRVAESTVDALDNNDYVMKWNAEAVVKAQQVAFDELNQKEPTRTSGGRRPNVDEEKCEKKFLKLGNIDPNIKIDVCNLLGIEQALGRDWRSLAGKLGYNVTAVQIFKSKGDPAERMLDDWNNGQHNYVERLVKELREMRREDIADILQKEIDKKGETCNCPDCGHIV